MDYKNNHAPIRTARGRPYFQLTRRSLASVKAASDGELVESAKKVLAANRKAGGGKTTLPNPHLYPHQWSWDSAFISIGYSNYNCSLGMNELESLFRGQWDNGMLPHIAFNPVRATSTTQP